jgi:D-aspartate ligase
MAIVLCKGINGLGAVRGLSRRHVRVIAVCFGENNPVRYSSAAFRKHHLADAGDEHRLLALLATYRDSGAVIIPCSDRHVEFLARHRDTLLSQGLRCAVPGAMTSEILNDKARELECLRSVAVSLPRSLSRLPDNADAIIDALSLPVIIKPRSYRHTAMLSTKNLVVSTRDELQQFLGAHREHLASFVAQEIIDGPDESLWVCNCCFNNGVLVSAFSFQRIRTSPAHFGVTSFAISRHNEDVKRLCAAIGRALRYVGPAMIEFKHDPREDRYYYIETNPRIGMCNWFDTMSGVENVFVAYQLARGDSPIGARTVQQEDVVFLNVFADFYSRYVDGEPVVKVLRSYWRTARKRHAWAYFTWSDPGPFLRAFAQATHRVLRSLLNHFVRFVSRR